jgi:hypothetical protein
LMTLQPRLCPWEEFASFSGEEQVSNLYGRPAIHPCCPDLHGVLGRV